MTELSWKCILAWRASFSLCYLNPYHCITITLRWLKRWGWTQRVYRGERQNSWVISRLQCWESAHLKVAQRGEQFRAAHKGPTGSILTFSLVIEELACCGSGTGAFIWASILWSRLGDTLTVTLARRHNGGSEQAWERSLPFMGLFTVTELSPPVVRFNHRSLLCQKSYQTTLARVRASACGEQQLGETVVECSGHGRWGEESKKKQARRSWASDCLLLLIATSSIN